jgi:hypothetical protein
MGEKRNAGRVFVGKLEGKRPLGRHRFRWDYTIKVDVTNMMG